MIVLSGHSAATKPKVMPVRRLSRLLALVAAIGLLSSANAGAQVRDQRPSGSGATETSRHLDASLSRIRETIRSMEANRGWGDIGVPREDGELLHRLAEQNGVRNAVEIGTFRGYSGLWIALALRKTGGRLTTFEIDPDNARRAGENFRRAGVDDIVTIVVGDAHVEVTKLRDPIDLLFIDADKDGYLDYLNKLLPLVRVGGLIVAHNMRRPRPDPRFVSAITTNPALETEFVHMDGAGVAITRKRR